MALVSLDAGSLEARSRDADASRLQAHKVELPSSHNDRLSPPRDQVDWRYFTLDKAARVTLEAKLGADDSGAELGLTTATGREVATVRLDAKSATITERLEQGVYYVRVQAAQATSYTLSVRD